MSTSLAFLAALLLRAGHVVPAGRLDELLWDPVPPPSAGVTLQNYVKRLRKALGAERDRIETQPGGYLIRVHRGELDVDGMREAVAGRTRPSRREPGLTRPRMRQRHSGSGAASRD